MSTVVLDAFNKALASLDSNGYGPDYFLHTVQFQDNGLVHTKEENSNKIIPFDKPCVFHRLNHTQIDENLETAGFDYSTDFVFASRGKANIPEASLWLVAAMAALAKKMPKHWAIQSVGRVVSDNSPAQMFGGKAGKNQLSHITMNWATKGFLGCVASCNACQN